MPKSARGKAFAFLLAVSAAAGPFAYFLAWQWCRSRRSASTAGAGSPGSARSPLSSCGSCVLACSKARAAGTSRAHRRGRTMPANSGAMKPARPVPWHDRLSRRQRRRQLQRERVEKPAERHQRRHHPERARHRQPVDAALSISAGVAPQVAVSVAVVIKRIPSFCRPYACRSS